MAKAEMLAHLGLQDDDAEGIQHVSGRIVLRSGVDAKALSRNAEGFDFNGEFQMLNTTRWIVVSFDGEKPKKEFFLGHHSVRTDIRQTDMESAAEEAVEAWNNSMSEYPIETIVGVMPYSVFDELELSIEYNSPSSLVSPNLFTWFNVECYPVPTYRAQKL